MSLALALVLEIASEDLCPVEDTPDPIPMFEAVLDPGIFNGAPKNFKALFFLFPPFEDNEIVPETAEEEEIVDHSEFERAK